jgi:hypothetical protein
MEATPSVSEAASLHSKKGIGKKTLEVCHFVDKEEATPSPSKAILFLFWLSNPHP